MARPMLLEGETTQQVIGAYLDVYRNLGFGFHEAPYSRALGIELQRRGMPYEREVPVELTYLGAPIGTYRIDLIVARRVVVEVKANQQLSMADARQLLNYLKATDLEVGILLNFGPTPQFRRFLFTNDRKSR